MSGPGVFDGGFDVCRTRDHEPENGVLSMHGYVNGSAVEAFVGDGPRGGRAHPPRARRRGGHALLFWGTARPEPLTIHPTEAIR